MKTLKVVLQEVVSGLKSWVNTNTVHKTGNEIINGVKTFSDGIVSDVTGSATSVPWTGVTGKPNDYPPSSHTHTKSQITDFPTLATVATSGSYNDLNNIPASFTPSSHTHGNITNDGKVGTTANLPLITGTGGAITAGAFGNQANTFCEGNDSRLSDARTPVAHTHSKADITDLLNSDFIPSANNSYDLGSSSYQWNNLYAKSYYYNGVAWGLDQANVWNTYQTIKGYYFGNEQSTNGRTCLYLTSNRDTVGQSGIYITKFRQNRAQGAMNPADLQFISFDVLENSIRTNSALQLNVTDWNEDGDVPNGAVLFSNLSNAQLGSPLAPWKTLNGINPGALSLPNLNYSDTNQWIDLSGNITDETGGSNEYDPTIDGWVVIRANGNPTYLRVNVHAPRPSARKYVASATGVAAPDGTMVVSVPAPAGSRVYIFFNKGSGSLDSATFITCQGNV